MSPSPSVGQWVWGDRMNPCQVVDIGTRRSTGQTMLKVLGPQGSKVIPLDKVRGCSDTPLVGAGPSAPISPEPTTETLPKSIAIGTPVGKRLNLGWLGWVQSEPVDGRCEVLWQYDRHPTLEKLTDLKIKEIK
jgi:hypothetical protein